MAICYLFLLNKRYNFIQLIFKINQNEINTKHIDANCYVGVIQF